MMMRIIALCTFAVAWPWRPSASPRVAIGSIRLSGPEMTYDHLGYSTIPAPATLAMLGGFGALAGRKPQHQSSTARIGGT